MKTSWLAAAGLTAMPVSKPVRLGIVHIRGHDVLCAGRFQGDVERAGAAADGEVARQDGIGVAARDLDGAGIAGIGGAVGVEGRDREGLGRARRELVAPVMKNEGSAC